MFWWRKPVSGDVAAGGVQLRHQVGGGVPRLGRRCPASARDLFGLDLKEVSSFECLVFAEVGDGHSEGIDGNQFVGDLRLEEEDEVRGVKIPFQFAVISG